VSLKDEKAKIEEFYNLVRQAEESDYLVAEFLDVLRHKGIPTLSGIIDYLIKYDLYQVKDGFHTPMEEIDAVTLITVHSAKGLEYKNVVLMTRQFKDERTNTNTEEKRLLYVGVTRAKDALTVILPSSQKNFSNLIKRKKV
jgi:superfamily I DNA/RNA helicase